MANDKKGFSWNGKFFTKILRRIVIYLEKASQTSKKKSDK